MDRLRQAFLLARLVIWCALFWFIFDGLPHIAAWRQRGTTPAAPAKPAGFTLSLTITPSAIQPGQPATLCYEVTGARSFTLAPLPPNFSNAPRACLPVSPQATTRYTLTATDALNSKLSRSLPLTVQPAAR